ncbi:hypothetical protein ACOSP7_014880 [Xanthoceras sorbifolium]
MEDINRATFSTAPASSNCVIFVINLCYRANKFCVSTFSLGDTTWSSHWFNDYHGHGPLIYNVAYAKGVFYCAFHAFDVMGAYNPALREWKLHLYPPVFKRPYQYHLSLIESPDDGNLILLSYNYNDPEYNGISLPAEGEASKLANTIYSTSFRWYRWCTSRGGKGGTHQSPCPQIYDWVDEGADRLWKVWIQPPQTR